jgi:hypothetical protein
MKMGAVGIRVRVFKSVAIGCASRKRSLVKSCANAEVAGTGKVRGKTDSRRAFDFAILNASDSNTRTLIPNDPIFGS